MLPVVGNSSFRTTYAAVAMLKSWGYPTHLKIIGQITSQDLQANHIKSLQNLYYAIRLLKLSHQRMPEGAVKSILHRTPTTTLSNLYWAVRIDTLLEWPTNRQKILQVLRRSRRENIPADSTAYYQQSYERVWLANRSAVLSKFGSIDISIPNAKTGNLAALYFWAQTQQLLGRPYRINVTPFQRPTGGFSILPQNAAGDILSTYFGWKLETARTGETHL
uniref:Uncharacterized protein n=1 Tax=Sulfobacillus thermotolerans TaxID=338644 RepID=G5CJ97_9FIRM|nr:hypothetical protein [Sulfobacillus thermotolerans]